MYTFDSRIRFSESDSQGYLPLTGLLNYFQDASTFQSEDLGRGLAYTKANNLVWVLSAWQIVVDRYPKLGDKVTIGTFPYDFKAFIGLRNFCMMDENGEYLARANSVWSLLSTENGKPVQPSKELLSAYELEEKLDMEYAPRKIPVPAGGQVVDVVTVKKQHLDTNHHVNNGQYVEMAMTFLPESFVIGQLRAEYKKQAFLGDVLYPYVVQEGSKYVVHLTDADGKTYVLERDNVKVLDDGGRGFVVRNASVRIGGIYLVNGVGYTKKTGTYACASYAADETVPKTDTVMCPEAVTGIPETDMGTAVDTLAETPVCSPETGETIVPYAAFFAAAVMGLFRRKKRRI